MEPVKSVNVTSAEALVTSVPSKRWKIVMPQGDTASHPEQYDLIFKYLQAATTAEHEFICRVCDTPTRDGVYTLKIGDADCMMTLECFKEALTKLHCTFEELPN